MKWPWRRVAEGPREVSAGEPMGASWPGGFDTGDEARKSRIVGRVFAVAFGLQSAVGVVLVGALMSTWQSCNTRQPFFLTTAPAVDAVVTVEPMRQDGDALKLATRLWTREFVAYRHTVHPDVGAQTKVLTWLKERTANQVWSAIESERQAVVDAIRQGISRRVEVSSVVEQSDRFYLVDFTVIDSRRGEEIGRTQWRAGVRVDFLARSVPRGALLDKDATNPFGYVVTGYVPQPLGEIKETTK